MGIGGTTGTPSRPGSLGTDGMGRATIGSLGRGEVKFGMTVGTGTTGGGAGGTTTGYGGTPKGTGGMPTNGGMPTGTGGIP